MPKNLEKYLGDKLSTEEILKIFGSIRTARIAPPEIRAGVIKAYDDTVYVMYLPALILCKFGVPPSRCTANSYHLVVQASSPSSLPSLPGISSWVTLITLLRIRGLSLVRKIA